VEAKPHVAEQPPSHLLLSSHMVLSESTPPPRPAPEREAPQDMTPPPVQRTCQEQGWTAQALLQGVMGTTAEKCDPEAVSQTLCLKHAGGKGSDNEADESRGTPAAGLAMLLRAGLADEVPVHLTHAFCETLDSKNCAPLPQSSRDAVLAHALSGAIRVRVITKPNAGGLTGKPILSPSVGASEVSDTELSDVTRSAHGLMAPCAEFTESSEADSAGVETPSNDK